MNKKGFTAVELLLVIVIISILSSIVVGAINANKSNKNYEICNTERCYKVESYTKETNCVFIAELETRICGNYTIQKMSFEEN